MTNSYGFTVGIRKAPLFKVLRTSTRSSNTAIVACRRYWLLVHRSFISMPVYNTLIAQMLSSFPRWAQLNTENLRQKQLLTAILLLLSLLVPR